ncbi:MAG: hypothetical protein ACRD3V_11540 [Vicinamibacteria bacterium]
MRAALAAAASFLSLVAIFLLWGAGRVDRSGTFDFDPMSLFLCALVAGALLFASLAARGPAEPIGLLLLRGSLSIAAVSTRDLLWSVTAILLFTAVGRERREKTSSLIVSALIGALALAAVAYLCRGTDLAVIAASDGARTAAGKIALGLLAVGLATIWLVESRNLLRSSASGLTTRVAASFALQVAVASVLLRITAWLPDAAPAAAIQAMALAALGAGALGALSSTRITTFVTALALARFGFAVLALLGGVHGRAPFLLELAAGGIALLLVALAFENLKSLDEVARIESTPRRLCLLFGAFTASSFPPFPGYFAAFPLVSAVLTHGHSTVMIAAGIFTFVLSLGSMRLVSRAWQPRSSTSSTENRSDGRARLGLAFALAATWALTLAPSFVVELATIAALEMF